MKKSLDDCTAEDDERHYFVLSQLQSLLGELEQIRRLTHELQVQVHGENIKGVAAH